MVFMLSSIFLSSRLQYLYISLSSHFTLLLAIPGPRTLIPQTRITVCMVRSRSSRRHLSSRRSGPTVVVRRSDHPARS